MKKFAKILSILLCLSMVIGMAAVAFADDGETTTASFTKVTTAPSDWSGTYLMIYEVGGTAKILDGSNVRDAENNYVTATAGNTITIDPAYAITIEAVEGGYTIKGTDGKYIYSTSNANKLQTTTDAATAVRYPNTITMTDGILDIYSTSTAHLRFNDNATDGQRYRYYKAASYDKQQAVSLYKLVEAAPEAPETPDAPEPTIKTELVLSALPSLKSMGVTPAFGYYDNAEMTGDVIDYQAAPGEDACLVDGNTGNSGWSGNFAFTDLVDNGGTKVPVILASLGTATTVGGIELISVDSSCSAPTHFAIQVTTTADEDNWETVLEAKDVTWNRKEIKQFVFTKTVDAYKIRLVVFNLAPLGDKAETQFALHELTLMSAKEIPAVDKVPLSGDSVLGYGYYSDLELTAFHTSVLSNNVPANAFDNNTSSLVITNTESWTWGMGGGMAGNGGTNTAAMLLDVTQNGEPSILSYMEMVVQGQFYYAPTTYQLQVTTSAEEDNWTTVYEATDFSWENNGTNSFYITFPEVSAYKARLLVAKTHVDQNNLCYFGLAEFVLGAVQYVTSEITWNDLIPESSITSYVGYYADGDYSTLTDINEGESSLLTNANVGNNAWINGNTFPVPDGKVPAAELDLGATKIVAGVELVGNPGQYLTAFDIDVLNTKGEWQRVYTTATSPFVNGSTVKIVFEEAVEGSKVRLVINDWDGDHPILKEMWVYEGKTDAALVQVPVADITASQNPVVPDQSIDKAIDGDKFSYYQIGAGNMPVVINFDTTNADGSATNVSRMRIFAYHSSKYAPKDIIVEVRTGDETWETVYTGVAYELGHTDTYTLDFDATYAAFDVRLTVNTYTAQNLILTEVELFGNGETVAPPVVDPTDPEPTDPEPTDPDPTDPEPTDPEPTDPEPTDPEPTIPEDDSMQKIDLSGSVVGCDSQDSATQSDYSQLTWYSTLNPGWKDLTIFTDGDYTNEIHWGLDPHERADVYIDLTKNTGAAVAVDQFRLHHSTYRDVPSVFFVLVLEDGTYVENTATLNWKQDVAADPFVFDYDQTYNAVGLYVWQNQNVEIRAAFGEIELYQRVDEPTDPEPTDPEPTDPEPTDPEPTDPEPTDPEPTDPEPTDPEPTDPEPTDPEPTDPEPTDPEPTDPEPTDPEVPADKITATLTDKLEDGDKIVIYYNDGKTVIGTDLTGAEAVMDGDKLVVSEGMLVLTVTVDENGNITFVTEDGKYLTSGATGNSLTLADEASEYSLWVLEAKDGGVFIKNVNAAYNGNAQYLEHYKGKFTTYGFSATSDAKYYTFTFYALETADVEDPTDPPVKTGDVVVSVLVGLIAISAIGGAVVVSKKKEM